jgi:hypothetical protein
MAGYWSRRGAIIGDLYKVVITTDNKSPFISKIQNIITPAKNKGVNQSINNRNLIHVQERKNRRKRVMNDFATIACSVKAADTTRRKEESF